MPQIAADNESPCQACGACCSYSQNWPRFTTEDDAALDLIPEHFVNERLSGMRCDGDRCSALPMLQAYAPGWAANGAQVYFDALENRTGASGLVCS